MDLADLPGRGTFALGRHALIHLRPFDPERDVFPSYIHIRRQASSGDGRSRRPRQQALCGFPSGIEQPSV